MAISRSGRTVIVPGIDQNYDRRVDPAGEQKTPGIPQVMYLENVLPTVEGYQSVGYKSLPDLPFTGQAGILEIRSAEFGANPEIVIFRIGALTAWRWDGASWESITMLNTVGAPNFASPDTFSFAVLNGFVVIFDGDNIWSYSPNTPSMLRVDGITANTATFTPPGVLDDLVAVTSSQGYLLFLKDDGASIKLLWSSTLSIFDFVPSLVTGAGGGALQEAQGRAVGCSGASGGFYVYNTQNLILGTYTGNSRYPFKFQVVRGAEGIQDTKQVHMNITDYGPVYVNKFRAIVNVQGSQGESRAPEITEFLERVTTTDVFNYGTNIFSEVPLGSTTFPDETAPYIYANRYLCLSYQTAEQLSGIQPFNVIYVYDTLLQRYGRLRADHTNLVTMFEGTRSEYLGFINTRTGKFQRLNFDAAFAGIGDFLPMQGVALFGKFQYVRSRRICMEEVEVEGGTDALADTSVLLYTSQNGKTFDPPSTPYETADSTPAVKKYLTHVEGVNVSVLVKGAFNLTTLQLVFHPGGGS
jgi:hypothetical protein